MKSVCVFAGSNSGVRPAYLDAASDLGRTLAANGIAVVYGGARVGLMGAVADAALAVGGRVIGVIPEALMAREVAHRNLSELHVVKSMHERKALMADLSDGFVALPGGMGTLDELFEIVTWAQLGIHGKPMGVLNVECYFDPLLAFIAHSVREGFVRAQHGGMIQVAARPAELLQLLAAFEPSTMPKWIGGGQSEL